MKLKVHGIRLEAAHAAYEWEQKLGTVLEVDVELSYKKNPGSDRLSGVVPVERVVDAVYLVSDKKTYRIIEMLADDIADALWKSHRKKLDGMTLRVKKIRPKSDRRIAGYEVEVCRP